MGAWTEPVPLGKHFLLLVKNGGSFIFVRLMGSYPVFSGWISASSPAPGDPCPVCRHLAGTALGGSRVGERVRRTRCGEARSPREARVGRAEAGGGQRLRTRGLGLFPVLQGSPAARSCRFSAAPARVHAVTALRCRFECGHVLVRARGAASEDRRA